MKKFKFSSRVLAFVLAFVMIVSLFPLSALAATQFDIVTTKKYVGTGIDNDTLNQNGTINWPIKVYDYLADGMLFEFAQSSSSTLNSTSKGSVSDDNYGGQYVLGEPMPYAAIGHDFTTTASYSSAVNTAYSESENNTYVKTKKAAVNYSSPQYMRISRKASVNGNYLNCRIADFTTDGNGGRAYGANIRYITLVYRAEGLNVASYTGNSGTNTINYMGFNSQGVSWYRSTDAGIKDINGNYVRNTGGEWKSVVIDISQNWGSGNWDTIKSSGINYLYIRLSFGGSDSSKYYFDLSHIAFFADSTSAKNYGAQCLKFISEPGEFVDGTQWNGANNTAFGMLHPTNGAPWANASAAGGAVNNTSAPGYQSTGYYTHRIGYWIPDLAYSSTTATSSNDNRKTGKDADGRFNGSGDKQGENGIYYMDASNYTSNAGTDTYDMSKLDFGGYNLLTDAIKGVWTAGLLQNTLGTDGTPQYKQETVEYIADMLSKTLVIPKTYGGKANYNYVAGVKNAAQYGTDSSGKARDLAQAFRDCLGITFTSGASKGSTPKMGTYAATLAKANDLKGAFKVVSGQTANASGSKVNQITTCMDAAYYLLHNLFIDNSYNQLQDDFTYLTLSSAKLDNDQQAYVFDGGFSNGAEIEDVINGKMTQAEYKSKTKSAVEYSGYNSGGNGTISHNKVQEKDYFYYSGANSAITTKYPFLPVVDADEGTPYRGQTDSYYFAEDGKRSTTLDNDTYYGRNYGYTLVSNGEFVYNEDDELFFEFEGDDDVYLFINNQLVLDLGGGHSVSSCRFDVNDYVKWARTVLADPTSYSDLQVARAKALDLEDGEIAKFDFYYMERHGYGANMRILTNMHITDPALRVEKQAFQGGKEIDYGGIVDGDSPIGYKFNATNNGNKKLYNLTFDDADIGVSLTPEKGLFVKGDDTESIDDDWNGSIVTDSKNGTLDASDLVATLKGYKEVGTGGDYNLDYTGFVKVEDGTGRYDYVVAKVTFADNEELKKFLIAPSSSITGDLVVDEEKTRSGAGLWVDTTLTFEGIYYTMTPDQREAGSFNNTVYVTGTTKAKTTDAGCETLRSNDNHRVYITAIPCYYQWQDNDLHISKERILEDAIDEANNKGSLLNAYEAFFSKVSQSGKGVGAIYTSLCDKKGNKVDNQTGYEFVKSFTAGDGKEGFKTNYDTPGIHEFYLLMYLNNDVAGTTVTGDVKTMKEGQYAIVRVLVLVTNVEDATYVLDYGLKTENLDKNGILFKDDELLGSLGGIKAKLMGINTTGGSYLNPVGGGKDYNRIDFSAMELDEHNDIYVNGKDGSKDGYYTFNMKIPAEGKDITYNKLSGFYSLTDAGTSFVHAYVPYSWDELYLYYWYDDGTDNIWPGEPMTKTANGTFSMAVPGNVQHVIISNGEKQSVDININPGEEVWLETDGTTNSEGKMYVTTNYKSTEGIIHAQVPEGWGDVYLYCWDAFGNGIGSWPGTKIEAADADGYYTLTIPGDITNVIINNGDDTVTETRKQTEDLIVAAGKETWITVADNGIENTSNPIKYKAVVSLTTEQVNIHATVPSFWENAYLYYWNNNGDYGPQWPGSQMTKGDNGVYTLEVPADVEYVIVNDGTFRQTENLEITAGLETWINVETLTTSSTVEANKPDDWDSVYFYFFKEGYDGRIAGDWPGVEGEDWLGFGKYTCSVPPYATHVVINNGKIGDEAYLNVKTKDLALSAETINSFLIENTGETVVQTTIPTWWSNPCMYYWTAGSDAPVAWPGAAISPDENGNFSYVLPEGTTHVIFSGECDDGRRQTPDIELTTNAINTISIDDNYGTVTIEKDVTVHATSTITKVVPPSTTTTATITYGADAEEEGLSFTPINFMDSEYNLWMALTVHDKDIKPTALGTGINIGMETQMIKKLTVLPASVVYYEDNFAGVNYADSSKTSNVINHYSTGSGSLTQSVDQNQQYGNDKAYQGSENDEMTGGSLTDIYVNDKETFATFDFTGTGFEIIGHTHAENSGTIKVVVKDKNGKKVKDVIAITEFDNGADGGRDTIVSIPIIRVNGLDFGSYTVEISGVPVYNFGNWTDKTQAPPVDTSYLCIDGFRVYQPISGTSQVTDAENLALGKSYTDAEVALAESLTGVYYTANLTDGEAADYIDPNFGTAFRYTWFGYNKLMNVKTAEDDSPYGQVTIDLEEKYSLSDFKIHVGNKSLGTPSYLNIYVSTDKSDWKLVGGPSNLNADATEAYWAELKLDEPVEGRYVRMHFGFNSGSYWVMLNEIEVYGSKVVSGSGVHDAYIENERGATFKEIRNLIADRQAFAIKYDDENGLSVSGGTNTWIENRNNVLPGDHNTKWTNNTVNSINDYLLAGPNNEVYMIESTDAEKSALAFYVTETDKQIATMQISIRALDYGSYIGSYASGNVCAEIQYGAVADDGSLVWRTLATTVSASEQYVTIPYSECPYDETLGRHQVVLRVADSTPTGMASFTTLKYNGLELLTLNETEVPDVFYGEDLRNTLLDSDGNTLDTSKFVGFIDLVDQMQGVTEPVQSLGDSSSTSTEPVITGSDTSSMGVLYDTFTPNTSVDFGITDTSKIYIVTGAEDTPPADDVIETAQLVQRQFAADGYDMQVVWGLEKYATKGDIIIYTGSAYSSNGDEGYTLEVTDRAKLQCEDEDGLLYGLNTLQKHFRAAGTNAIKGFTIVDAPDTLERTVHLDVARKYMSVEGVKNYIAQLSWQGYNSIELHMSEDGGMRMDFWGDKALTEVPGMTGNDFTWICGDNPPNWVFTHFREVNGKYLTTEEIIEICETAKMYHIDIIPSFDTPAHVGYMTELYYNTVKANSNSSVRNFTYNGKRYTLPTDISYGNYASTGDRYDFSVLDLSNESVRNFAYAMYNDIAAFFAYYAGSSKFNIGADEVDIATNTTWNYTHFISYVNDVNDVLKYHGYRARMYNDFLYNTNYTSVTTGIDTDIDVVYWLPATSTRTYLRTASFYANQGRTVYNGNLFWTYYVLRIAPDKYNTSGVQTNARIQDARDPNCRQWEFYRNQEDYSYNEFTASQTGAYTDTNMGESNNYSGDKLGGAYFMIWNDFAGLNTEVEVWNGCYNEYGTYNRTTGAHSGNGQYYSMMERMWSNAIKQWNSDINDTLTFANFEIQRDKMGLFPGYVKAADTQTYLNDINLPEEKEVDAAYRTYYDVTFVNYDGTVLQTISVKEDNTATYTAATPTKPANVWYTYTFSGWNKELTKITSNMTVIAQYEQSATIAGKIGYLELKSSGGSNIQMSVDGGTEKPVGLSYTNSSMDFGKFITVKAVTNNDNEFVGWINAKTGEIVSTNATYNFYTSGNDVFVAMYAVDHNEGKSLVTFRNDKTNQIIDMQYYSADDYLGKLTSPKVVDYPGYEHAGWDCTDAQIVAAIEKGENITVTTKWVAKPVYFKITVSGGSVTDYMSGGVDDMFQAYKATTVTANSAPSGKKFAYWQDEQGRIVSYNQTYKMFPHKNTELTAVFVSTSDAVNGTIVSTVDIDATTLGDANTVFFSWDASASDYTIINTGVLLVKRENYLESTFGVGTIDSAVRQFVPAISHSNTKVGSYSVTIPSVSEGDTWIAKSFVQYRDADGIVRVVYSDLAEATK